MGTQTGSSSQDVAHKTTQELSSKWMGTQIPQILRLLFFSKVFFFSRVFFFSKVLKGSTAEMTEMDKRQSWKSIFWISFTACLVLVVTDIAAGWVAPVHHLREVEDAVNDLQTRAPTWLVIGSSHARTFTVVGNELSRRSKGKIQMLAVPVEFGKMTSYEWVIQHRLHPLFEAKTAQGKLRRARLRHVLLVTEWWDSVDVEGGKPAHNLPARAWHLTDFLNDVWNHGLTPYNQNYIRNRWMRLGYSSTLISDRGHGQILKKLRERIRPLSKDTKQDLYQQQMRAWQRMVQAGPTKMLHPKQMAAFKRILTYFQQRKIQVSVLLYPRMPGTITAKAKKDTLDAFATAIKKICAPRHIRVIDLSHQSPLQDSDFTPDFDHVTQQGNKLFTQWALKGPLRFLLAADERSHKPTEKRGKKP